MDVEAAVRWTLDVVRAWLRPGAHELMQPDCNR
jgi:hypothetical protein